MKIWKLDSDVEKYDSLVPVKYTLDKSQTIDGSKKKSHWTPMPVKILEKVYGWDVAVYSSPEHIYGCDYVTSCYKEDPQKSWKRIVDYMHEIYPIATDKQIKKILK